MLKNGAKTFTLVARYSTIFGTKKCYAFLVQENLRFSLHNKIYDFVCTNAKRKDKVLRKKSLRQFFCVRCILKIRESADFYDSIWGMERFKFQHR